MLILNLLSPLSNFCNSNSSISIWLHSNSSNNRCSIWISSNSCGSLRPLRNWRKLVTRRRRACWRRTSTASPAEARSWKTRRVRRRASSARDFGYDAETLPTRFRKRADQCNSSTTCFSSSSNKWCNSISRCWLRNRKTATAAVTEDTIVAIAESAAVAARYHGYKILE